MKNILVLSAILAGLAGCSSSDDAPSGVSATVTTAQLIGTWLLTCEADGAGGSIDGSVTLTAATGDVEVNVYDDANCQTVNMIEMESFTYTLGADFALDGTVAGITTGTELDSTNTTPGSLNLGEITYDSIALVGTSLYISDDEADPLKDGSSPAARPTKLDDAPLIKQ